MKGPHDFPNFTIADENAGGPRFVGAEIATGDSGYPRDLPSRPHFHKNQDFANPERRSRTGLCALVSSCENESKLQPIASIIGGEP